MLKPGVFSIKNWKPTLSPHSAHMKRNYSLMGYCRSTAWHFLLFSQISGGVFPSLLYLAEYLRSNTPVQVHMHMSEITEVTQS